VFQLQEWIWLSKEHSSVRDAALKPGSCELSSPDLAFESGVKLVQSVVVLLRLVFVEDAAPVKNGKRLTGKMSPSMS